jgi:hypothetical protein
VHSSTGLKLLLRRIADALEQLNAKREEQQKVLMCVDGVHGYGVEDIEIKERASLLAEASTLGVGCSLTALLQNDTINHVGRHWGAKTEQRFYLVRRLDL